MCFWENITEKTILGNKIPKDQVFPKTSRQLSFILVLSDLPRSGGARAARAARLRLEKGF